MNTNINFEKTSFKFEEPLVMGSKDNKLSWDFTGASAAIEYIKPACGSCTTNCRHEDGQILADFAELDASRVRPQDIDRLYPDKLYSFSKSISVYLDDGKELRIVDKEGNKRLNPTKKKIVLTFGGTVDISSLAIPEV